MAIPIFGIPDKPIVNSTQSFIPIADITDNMILMKNGAAALVMESTSLNFQLLSGRERQAVIAAYAGLLNSLNFPVQILVRSQKKDISRYIDYINTAKENIDNPKLANIMDGYIEFISGIVKKKNVLSKNFYIVVPFSQYELGVTKSLAQNFQKKQTIPYTKSYILRKAKTSLLPKRDHLMRQAGRLSLVFRQLTTEDLIKLFYNFYNPEKPVVEKKNIL